MRRRTPKRSAQERQYLARRAIYLTDRKCAGFGVIDGCQGRADTVQHLRGRRGDRLLDERFWLPLCWQPCHQFAEANPYAANELGLRLSRVGLEPGDAA